MSNNDYETDLAIVLFALFSLGGYGFSVYNFIDSQPIWSSWVVIGVPILILIILFIWWLKRSFFSVKENHIAILTRFKKFYKTVPAGLHFYFNPPIKLNNTVYIGQISTYIYFGDKSNSKYYYDDIQFKDCRSKVFLLIIYKIIDPSKFVFGSDESEYIMLNRIETRVRYILSNFSIVNAVNLKDEIDLKNGLKNEIEYFKQDLGVNLIKIELNTIKLPDNFSNALDNVLVASKEAESFLIKKNAEVKSKILFGEADAKIREAMLNVIKNSYDFEVLNTLKSFLNTNSNLILLPTEILNFFRRNNVDLSDLKGKVSEDFKTEISKMIDDKLKKNNIN